MALAAFLASLIEGAAEILHALALMGAAFGEAFVAIGLALAEAIVALAGPISTGLTVLLIVLIAIATEYMDPLIDKLIDFIDKFLDRLLDEVLPAIGDWIWKIVVKVADLLLLALEGLAGLIPGIGQVWREGLQNVRKTVDDYWDEVLDARQLKRSNERKMRMIQEGLVDAAGNVDIAGRANSLGQAYVDDYLGALKNGSKDISKEAGNISGVMQGIRHDTGDTSGRSGSFDDVVDSAKRSVGKYSGSVGDFSNVSHEMTDNMKDIRDSADETSENLSRNAKVAQDVINGKYGNGDKRRNALLEAGYDPDEVQRTVNAILSGEQDIKVGTDNVGDSVDGTVKSVNEAEKASNSFLESLVQTAKGSLNANGVFVDLSETMKNAGFNTDGLSNSLTNVSGSLGDAEDGVYNFSDTLDALSTSVENATSDVSGFSASLDEMYNGIKNNGIGGFLNGERFSDGYISGILSGQGGVYNASYGIGRESIAALSESIDAHSPSRRTANLAKMWGIGFVDNLANFSNPAYRAGYEVGQESVDGLTNPFSTLHSGFDDLYSFSPTITPILDMSDVESGMYYLQNEFTTAPAFGVKQTWSPDIRSAEALLSLERPETDVTRVIDEMGYLRDDIVRMGEEISRMKVYLDTGVLVGEMSGPMDSILGQSTRRSVRSGRR